MVYTVRINNNDKNTDGSFRCTVADSNSLLSPLESHKKTNILGTFVFYFIMKMYVVCTH